jgi:5,10-methylenetetrahydromethanopterin reductase
MRSTEPYAGQVFSWAGGETLRWNVRRADIPILLGAWGEQTIRACLPYISELKLGGTANPALVRRTREFLDRECAAIGRAPDKVGIVVGAVSVVDRDGAAARALAKREVAMYLPVVAGLDPTLETGQAEMRDWSVELGNCVARNDLDGAVGWISDEWLKKFAFAGTPGEVAEQARALFEAGAARVEFGTPHGFSEAEGMSLLGKDVLPALNHEQAI